MTTQKIFRGLFWAMLGIVAIMDGMLAARDQRPAGLLYLLQCLTLWILLPRDKYHIYNWTWRWVGGLIAVTVVGAAIGAAIMLLLP